MACALHLLANAVHPSEAPEVHDFICSILAVKCSTPKWLLMSMMAYAVQLLANTVHQSEAPEVHDSISITLAGKCSTPKWGMSYAAHLLANSVHLSKAPDVHDRVYSTTAGKCSTPKSGPWCAWWDMQYTQVRPLTHRMAYTKHWIENVTLPLNSLWTWHT